VSNDKMDSETKARVAKGGGLVVLIGMSLGLIYGYDNGNIGGAALAFQRDLNLDTSGVEFITTAIVWGTLFGAIVGGWLANKIGRKPTMIMVAVGFTLFAIASAFSGGEATLSVARFLLGTSIGLSIMVVPLFLAESVPAAIRGRALVGYQLVGVVGIILGNLVAAGLTSLPDSYNWRIMLGVAALPALILIPLLMKVSETPNWLMMKGRREEALVAMKRVDPTADAEAEIQEIADTLAEEGGAVISEMFRRPFLRATVFVLTLGFLVQITGINATVTYGPQIFNAMGAKGTEALWLSVLVQCFAFAALVISIRYFIDTKGRRPTLMVGIAILLFGLVLSAVVSYWAGTGTYSDLQMVLGFAGLALINIGFVMGFGSMVWVYAAESFPGRLRAFGASLLLGADLIANIIVAEASLTVIEVFGTVVLFGGFAVLALFALWFVYKFAPETKGRQLDDIRFFWENGGKWPTDGSDGSGGVAAETKVH
jgi:SP family galactose:H+ symporter-like MFS transporter